MINYNVFNALFTEAIEYDNAEYFIAERGWQDWMNAVDESLLGDVMYFIYDCAKNGIVHIMDMEKNDTVFAKKFGIPYRTVQNWRLGSRKAPDYLVRILAFAELTDKFAENKESSEE